MTDVETNNHVLALRIRVLPLQDIAFGLPTSPIHWGDILSFLVGECRTLLCNGIIPSPATAPTLLPITEPYDPANDSTVELYVDDIVIVDHNNRAT